MEEIPKEIKEKRIEQESITLSLLQKCMKKEVDIDKVLSPLDILSLDKKKFKGLIEIFRYYKRKKGDHSVAEIVKETGISRSLVERIVQQEEIFTPKRKIGRTQLYEISKQYKNKI